MFAAKDWEGTQITMNETPHRPAVLHDVTETQMQELELQASEYDREEFFRVAATYGWDEETIAEVWTWFEVLPAYPLEGTEGTEG